MDELKSFAVACLDYSEDEALNMTHDEIELIILEEGIMSDFEYFVESTRGM